MSIVKIVTKNDQSKIEEKLRNGEISPEEALNEAASASFTSLGDISVDLNIRALRCGFPTLEHHQYLRANAEDIIVLAARPGVGKSAFATQLAQNVAKDEHVLLFSPEMSKEVYKQRALAGELKCPVSELKRKHSIELKEANKELAKLKLHLDDTESITVDTPMARAKEFHIRRPVALVVVDYLQILKTGKKFYNKKDQVAECMEKLKTLAKEISRPVLLLAQLNRAFETRLTDNPEARPIMSDLADAAEIEHWSDLILTMHRPYPEKARITVLKNRHGGVQNFDLKFNGEQFKFIDGGPFEESL